MPIVDVRNIPTVVEFAPENKVVEFTEEAVTAEVVVGPTVVEFSWGELIPEPGLSGGGVFEGRVYIRPDIPTLPTNSEPVDPNADYIMLYDASGDQHVKVLAALGGGGGGGVEFATVPEAEEAIIADKAIAPDVAGIVYDRLHHVGQHTAGKGTEAVALVPNTGVVTMDGALSNVFRLAMDRNVTFANPINPVHGQTVNIYIKQDVVGNRQITEFGSQWKFVNRITPVLSTAPNALDMLSCQWSETDNIMLCSFLPNYGSGYTPPPVEDASNLRFNNVGGGNEVVRDKDGLDVNFRTIVGEGDVVVTTVGDTIQVSYTAPSVVDFTNVPLLINGDAAEYPSLAAARGLLAGTGIEIDTSVAGQFTISSTLQPIPPGGTTTQVLSKLSETDYDVAWVDKGNGATGAFYTGENLGAGIGIYKETDSTTDPAIHKFKSLIAGDNILLTGGADEIVISTLGTVGEGATPPGFVAGQQIGTTGTSTTFTPSDFGGIAIGDLMFWVVSSNGINTNRHSHVPPAGWDVLWAAVEQNSVYAFTSYFYKRVDATDLMGATTHTVTRPAGTTVNLASAVYLYKNVHTVLPFAGAVASSYMGFGWGAHIPLSTTNAPCFFMHELPSATFTGTNRVGATVDYTTNLQPGSYSFNLNSWVGNNNEDENWIPGETMLSSGQDPSWTKVNVTVTRSGTYDGRMDPINGTARHYIEQSVSLVAGVEYMFAHCMKSQWQTGDQGQMTISYVDPAGNERLMHHQGTGWEYNSGACTRKDPLGDYGTTWTARNWTAREDGVPSTTGAIPTLVFTALTTGTYKLRIGISSTAEGEVCSTGATNRRFSGILFRRGWRPYRRVHTPNGAVYQGTGRSAAHSVSYLAGMSGASTASFYGLGFHPAWDNLPRARLHVGVGTPGDTDFALSDDGLTIYEYQPTSNDHPIVAMADRPIMPTVSGIPQKYYMEWTVLSGGTDLQMGMAYPFHQFSSNDERWNVTGYWWDQKNANSPYTRGFLTPFEYLQPDVGNGDFTTGDILGIAVDYSAKTVKFWKNNSLIKTLTMYDGTGQNDLNDIRSMMPLWAWGRTTYVGGTGDGGSLRANLSGPFTYPQPGHLAYDFVGSVAVTPISELVNVGTGYPIMAGTPSAPLIKSLADGEGIQIADNGTTLTLSVAKAEVPLVIPTTRVRGGGWSNHITINPAEAKPVAVLCPHDGIITSYTILGDAAGSAVVDVRKSTFDGLPAGSGARICGTDKPTLSAFNKAQNLSLGLWNVNVSAGEYLTFVLESCSGLSLLSVQLTIQEVIP